MPDKLPVNIATLAGLLALGCEEDCLDDAYDWLSTQYAKTSCTLVVAQFNEAIAVARSTREIHNEV